MSPVVSPRAPLWSRRLNLFFEDQRNTAVPCLYFANFWTNHDTVWVSCYFATPIKHYSVWIHSGETQFSPAQMHLKKTTIVQVQYFFERLIDIWGYEIGRIFSDDFLWGHVTWQHSGRPLNQLYIVFTSYFYIFNFAVAQININEDNYTLI